MFWTAAIAAMSRLSPCRRSDTARSVSASVRCSPASPAPTAPRAGLRREPTPCPATVAKLTVLLVRGRTIRLVTVAAEGGHTSAWAGPALVTGRMQSSGPRSAMAIDTPHRTATADAAAVVARLREQGVDVVRVSY